MPYYCFNKCPKKCLPAIEKLADELGLEELEGYFSSSRIWKGNLFKRRTKFDREFLVKYNSESRFPLMLQTSNPVTAKQEDVNVLLQKFIDIAKPTEISDLFDNYDMNEFR